MNKKMLGWQGKEVNPNIWEQYGEQNGVILYRIRDEILNRRARILLQSQQIRPFQPQKGLVI